MTQTSTITLDADVPVGPEPPSRPWFGVAALWLFAAVPGGLALLSAVRAPRMHVLPDYWHVLEKVTDDGGHLLLGQVFTNHLDQPFVIPSVLFWVDAAWFGGDNRVLTVVTVLLVVGIVLALRSMLPFSPVTKAALTAGASWVLLSSHAAELWLQGTNGMSWVPAVFFSTVAIASAHRGRRWIAYTAALLGCLSFGAALPVWFVLGLVAWLRGDGRTRVVVPLAIGVVVVSAWWVTKPAGPQSLATSAFDPDGRLSVVGAAVGGLWSADNPTIAVIAGAVTLALLALLFGRTKARAGWVGLAGYSVALAVMLALGRTTSLVPGGNVGLVSRYVLVSALATVALLALAALNRPQWPHRYVVTSVAAVALATHAIGGVKADNVRRSYVPLNLAAVAFRVDAPKTLDALRIQRRAAPAAQALHAYPFSDSFTLGCHGPELGDHVDLAAAQPLPTTATGPTHGEIDTSTVTGDVIITGSAVIDGTPPDCVLVVDATKTVTGAGITSLPRTADQPPTTPDGVTWQAVASPNTTGATVLAVKNGTLYRLSQ
ncbi:DUF2079 domain-containing protein [Actinocrispum wychmicini]|uniref:DUF2079 domain-containing protein n=1 Tax=Actinocrispum wychmicini TaxID=1213861 RepID=A0A4R2J846_9PSEU|nr:DUF2079 domain-containing protein [Actinocrispum wychmicini]TCO54774.1 hypothetical protein EV192_10862 [Actinocrispum wychmicini]